MHGKAQGHDVCVIDVYKRQTISYALCFFLFGNGNIFMIGYQEIGNLRVAVPTDPDCYT